MKFAHIIITGLVLALIAHLAYAKGRGGGGRGGGRGKGGSRGSSKGWSAGGYMKTGKDIIVKDEF